MVQTKKLIPEVYSHSFDMSIFTGLLDLIYTSRELDILRARNSHLPRDCFEEDLPRLASLFGLGDISNRQLLENYRHLVKLKGTKDVILAIVQFVCGLDPKMPDAKSKDIVFRVITDFRTTRKIKNFTPKGPKISLEEIEDRGIAAGTTVTIELYLNFTDFKLDLFNTLISRLAPVSTFVVVRPLAEFAEKPKKARKFLKI